MRRALGLLPSGSPRPRTRGGEGPVVEHRGDRQPGSSINRAAVAEAALAEERHAREQLMRQLRDAETALREAQTKRGHAELARDELLERLAAERAAREAAEERVRQILAGGDERRPEESAPAAATRVTRRRIAAMADPAEPAKRRGRPPGSVSKNKRVVPVAAEPEGDDSGAVEWWVPGWQDRI